MLFSDLAVVFFGRCYCCFPDAVIVFLGCSCFFPEHCCRFSRLLPFLFYAFVQKLLGICTKLKNFCIKSVRLLGMLFSDFAVVFRTLLLFSLDAAVVFSGHYCCFLRMLLPFPSVSAVFVSCFCTKTFGICTKHNIFCTKTGGNFSMFFQFFPDIFYPDLELFCFFP